MAEFNITITIPNDKVQDLIDAYNWMAGGSNGTDPNPRMTAGDIRDQEKQQVIKRMVHVYRSHKVWLHKEWLRHQSANVDDLGAS
jgi:hypothetical protein